MLSLATPAANLFASTLPSFFLRNRKQSYELNPPEQAHQVIYLGNVLTAGLGKGEATVDKPLNVIWRTWNSKRGQRQQIGMRLSVTRSGLKAETKQLGLTEYWAHRITFCLAPQQYPRVFCWVYKHEGKRMKPELRCHAILCKKASEPILLQQMLTEYLQAALQEYKREKLAMEKARKNSLTTTFPRRKILLQTGSLNFRPPVSRSRSAPRLGSIDEEEEEENVPRCIVEMSTAEEEEELTIEAQGEDEEEEEFSDLDTNSLNLEAHYRTTPVLSGDSSSQQSAPSVASSTYGDKNEEADEEHGNNHGHFCDIENCSMSEASTSSASSSISSSSSAASSSSGNSSLESNSSLLLLTISPTDQNTIPMCQKKHNEEMNYGIPSAGCEQTILYIGTDSASSGKKEQMQKKQPKQRISLIEGIIFGHQEIRL